MLCFDKLTIKTLLGHKKFIICFLGTARDTFNPRIKNFYSIPTSKCDKSSTHRELSVQSGGHLPCLLVSIVGWLAEFWYTLSRDSAPLIKSREFLRNIVGTLFLFAKGKKIKIKSRPPASFSEKKGLRNI